MQQIHDINASQSPTPFDDIDRVIHATRIEGMQELRKLVRFMDHLIQTLLHQISGGLLSSAGAKAKILHCFSLIQHCQIGNHPTIKSQLNKLINVFNQRYKTSINQHMQPFKPSPMVLSSATISHYIESIKDTQADPMYSEKPQPLGPTIKNTSAQKDQPKTPSVNPPTSLHHYWLSHRFFHAKKNHRQQLMAHATSTTMEIKKKRRMNQFKELKQSYESSITSTA